MIEEERKSSSVAPAQVNNNRQRQPIDRSNFLITTSTLPSTVDSNLLPITTSPIPSITTTSALFTFTPVARSTAVPDRVGQRGATSTRRSDTREHHVNRSRFRQNNIGPIQSILTIDC